MKRICILGSTGSIGTQSLQVCKKNGFEVMALSANSNVSLLAKQAIEFNVKKVCICDESKRLELESLLLGTDIEILTGNESLVTLASGDNYDVLLNAVVGIAGLLPTIAAIKAKKTIALANKETLVTGGKLVMEAARKNNVQILPVDSEHSAIFQSLQGNDKKDVKKLILTASGGPFFKKTRAELENVTVSDALHHPNWSMGAKITIDSATLMNKGLEVIEASFLFGVALEDIGVVVHRESIIHSLVEYNDNAVIAQLGVPDMTIPIQYALTYPRRYKSEAKPLSLTKIKTLTFDLPDDETFVCLKACKEALRRGGVYPAIVNGANEQAVELFLNGKISFLDIGRLVYSSLSLKYDVDDYSVEDVLIADKLAREFVLSKLN